MYAIEPPVLHVVRLDPTDRPLDYFNEKTEPTFEGLVPQQVLLQNFKVSWKTLLEYRKVALGYDLSGELNPAKGIPDYRTTALERNPDFPERMATALLDRMDGLLVRPIYADEPPFTHYESWCLKRIWQLYGKLRSRAKVEHYIQRNQQSFTKEHYDQCRIPQNTP